MGLDWRPLNKPKEGYEAEYEEIFNILSGKIEQNNGLFDNIKDKKNKSQEQLLDRLFEISISPYETLDAPKVGYDESATKWAAEQFEHRVDKSFTYDEFMQEMQGFYVLELIPKGEGIPMYIAMHDEAHVFRAQFLRQCEDVIGDELLNEAYVSKLANETALYAAELMKVADEYAQKHKCRYLKDQREPPDENEDASKNKAHILYSAAKWLSFWSSKGHGMEADF